MRPIRRLHDILFRYYPALKTLEQLEHTYLPRVASYRFAQQMRDNIPRVREDIKQASMSDIKDFLEAIRRLVSVLMVYESWIFV